MSRWTNDEHEEATRHATLRRQQAEKDSHGAALVADREDSSHVLTETDRLRCRIKTLEMTVQDLIIAYLCISDNVDTRIPDAAREVLNHGE